jgi:putative oxidoreductase
MMNCSKEKCADWGLLLLRVMLGVAFIYHGYGKLFGQMPGMEGFTAGVAKMGFPAPALFAYLAALIEFLGGIAVLIGFHVKHAGYLIALVMAIAIGGALNFGFGPTGFSFAKIELALVYLVMSLSIAWLGAGSMVLMNCPGGCCKGKCDCNKKDCKMCNGDKK